MHATKRVWHVGRDVPLYAAAGVTVGMARMPHLEASKIAGALLLAGALYSAAMARSSHQFEAMRRQIGQLGDAGRYDAAVALAEKALRVAQTSDGSEYASLVGRSTSPGG